MHALLLTAMILAEPFPVGNSTHEIALSLPDLPLQIFVHRPDNYRDGPLLLVFHGVLRNAEEYRDHSVKMAQRYRALVVAPKFDEQRFPISRYQQGGLLLNGEGMPREYWSGSYIPPLVEEIRKREGRPELPYYMIGHSGGGQFLVRFAGFTPNSAKRIVVANAGTHLFPLDEARRPYPFGFSKLPNDLRSEEQIKRYLAQPITLYLGAADTEIDEHLDVTEPAQVQGRTRFERGQNVYRAAEALAKEKGWPFGWRMVVVPGVGHDHEAMFDHELCAEALFGRP